MSPAPQIDSFANTTLAILAGGAGSRMGQPKGLLNIGNRPILDYLLDHLAWPGPTMLVTAPGREHPPGHGRFTHEVSDPISGAGPLRGILTALENLDTPLLLVLTVDMPSIRPPQCKWILGELLNDPQSRGVTMNRRMQIEPFPFALKAEARPILARRFQEGRRSVHGVLEENGFKSVSAPENWPEAVWTNLNTPEDVLNFAP